MPQNILPVDFYTAVGMGMYGTGIRRVTALGNNPDVDTVTLPEDIWPGGGAYPWKTAAGAMEVVSTSAADAAAGTGARTVLVQGLDASYLEISETVTLNGLTAVALVNSYLRINSALITSAGTGKVNAGDISIRDSGAGTTRSIIPLGYGITRQAVFTVPAAHTLSIHSQLYCINRQTGVGRFATFANFIQSPNGFYRQPLEISIGDEPPYRHDGIPGIVLTEKTDFALRCTALSADNTDLTAAFLGLLFKNTTTA